MEVVTTTWLLIVMTILQDSLAWGHGTQFDVWLRVLITVSWCVYRH